MNRDEVWSQWPDRDCWTALIRYGSLLALLWIVVYGGASYLTSLHLYRVRLHLDIEQHMPFFPSAAIIYLSLFPMLWLSVFILQTRKRLKSFAKALAWLFIVSGIGFLLLPGEDIRTRTVGTDFFGQIYHCADWMNMSNNYLPSLHVGMAILCARIYSRTALLKISVLTWLWATAIAFSTLLMHEHYLADVLTGGMLGYSIANLTYGNG